MTRPRRSDWLERLYRSSLWLYPPTFRERYGDEMMEWFRVRRARAGRAGVRARSRFWAELAADLAATATVERRAAARRLERARKEPKMDSLWQDLKGSIRRLADAPGFTAMALLITGLGIGANVAMFSVVESVLFRPPPWENIDELVWVYQDSDDGEPNSCSYPAFRDIARRTDSFAAAGAMIPGMNARYLSPSGEAQRVNVAYATASLFPTLGLSTSLGRWFGSEADVPGGEPVGVISHRAWLNRFSGDPSVIGQSIRLNGTSVTIVGVGPVGYRGELPGIDTELWLSIAASGPVGGEHFWNTLERRGDHWFMVVARLQDGVTAPTAQAAMDQLASTLAADYPEHNEGRDITVFSAADVRVHPEYDAMLFPSGAALMGIVGLVLLIACGNLANLLLAKASTRGREIAVRLAMGATRFRLVRQLLTESVVLSLAGGLLGLGVAAALGRWLARSSLSLPVPLSLEIRLDGRVLVFATLLSVATGIVFGLAPALKASRPDILPGLKAKRGIGPRSLRWRFFGLRNALVALQIAVSFVLLLGAGLLGRSLIHTERAPLGFAENGLAVVQADAGQAGYDPETARALFHAWRDRAAGLAEVESASLTSRLPVTPTGGSSTLEVEGYDPPTGTGKAEVIYGFVDEAYFRTMRIPLLHGRDFEGTDRVDSDRVAIVNEAFARRYWGIEDGTGRRYRHEGAPDSWVRIVGVVANAKVRSPHEAPTPMFFRPLAQAPSLSQLYLVARTGGAPTPLARVLGDELRELDDAVPIHEAHAMSDHVAASLGPARAGTLLVASFGLLALFLACLGLYAIVAFSVSLRTAEMGVRIALGASGKRIVLATVKETLVVVGFGIVIGTGLALLAAPLLQNLLFGVGTTDPLTYVSTALILALVAALAASLPARRAARTDPVEALRSA